MLMKKKETAFRRYLFIFTGFLFIYIGVLFLNDGMPSVQAEPYCIPAGFTPDFLQPFPFGKSNAAIPSGQTLYNPEAKHIPLQLYPFIYIQISRPGLVAAKATLGGNSHRYYKQEYA